MSCEYIICKDELNLLVSFVYIMHRTYDYKFYLELESLILAQNERWRQVLGMQVERAKQGLPCGTSGARVSNAWETALHWGRTFGNER